LLSRRAAAANDPFATKGTKDAAHSAVVDVNFTEDVAAVGFMLDHRGAQEFTPMRARLHAADRHVFAESACRRTAAGLCLSDIVEPLRLDSRAPQDPSSNIGMGLAIRPRGPDGMDKMTTHANYTPTFYQECATAAVQQILSLVQAANRANVAITRSIDWLTIPVRPHAQGVPASGANATGVASGHRQ
jgi:hypothetical protein